MLVSMLVLFLRRRFVTSQMPGDKSVGLDTTDSDVMFSINKEHGKKRRCKTLVSILVKKQFNLFEKAHKLNLKQQILY